MEEIRNNINNNTGTDHGEDDQRGQMEISTTEKLQTERKAKKNHRGKEQEIERNGE